LKFSLNFDIQWTISSHSLKKPHENIKAPTLVLGGEVLFAIRETPIALMKYGSICCALMIGLIANIQLQ